MEWEGKREAEGDKQVGKKWKIETIGRKGKGSAWVKWKGKRKQMGDKEGRKKWEV